MAKTIKVGDEVVISGDHVPVPTKAKVIAITKTPGKIVGVAFDDAAAKKFGVHDCDGHGPEKSCLWVHPTDVYTEKEAAALLTVAQGKAKAAAAKKERLKAEKAGVLEIDDKGTMTIK